MSDLVSGRYPQQEYWWSLLGKPVNATQADIPMRTNAYYLGLTAGLTDTAGAATKKGTMVAIPVSEGDVFTKVTVLVGATKSAANPQAVAAIYSGTTGATEAALVGNSAKASGETVMTENTKYTLELEKAVVANLTNAPNGYVYAGIAQESAEIASLMTATTPKKIFGEVLVKFITTAPACLAMNMTVASAGVASAKLDVSAGKGIEAAPIVFLS